MRLRQFLSAPDTEFAVLMATVAAMRVTSTEAAPPRAQRQREAFVAPGAPALKVRAFAAMVPSVLHVTKTALVALPRLARFTATAHGKLDCAAAPAATSAARVNLRVLAVPRPHAGSTAIAWQTDSAAAFPAQR
jgi:hypothetical protein